MSKKRKILIGGDWREASKSFEVKLPFTGDAERFAGDVVPIDTQTGGSGKGKFGYTLQIPRGVICGISRLISRPIYTQK